MFIWLNTENALNLDKVVEVSFFERVQFEQDGRRSWYPEEDFDVSKPMGEVKRELAANVTFDAVVEQELYAGHETVLLQKNYYGQAAERIRATLQVESL